MDCYNIGVICLKLIKTCSSYPHMDCYSSKRRKRQSDLPCSSYPHMDCYCNILCSASILNTMSGAIQKTNMIIGSIFKKIRQLSCEPPAALLPAGASHIVAAPHDCVLLYFYVAVITFCCCFWFFILWIQYFWALCLFVNPCPWESSTTFWCSSTITKGFLCCCANSSEKWVKKLGYCFPIGLSG